MSITIQKAIEKINLHLHGSKVAYENAISIGYEEAAEEFEKYMEAEQMAIDALREKAERENQQPLTIDELRQMNGLPVWVQELSGIRDNTGWALVEVDDSGVYKGVPFVKCHVCTWNVIIRGLHCYRHKPKEEQK